MKDVALKIKTRNGHRPSRKSNVKIHKLPATIRFSDRVRVQLEVPASSVEVVSGRNGDLVYRFEVEFEMSDDGRRLKEDLVAQFDKNQSDGDSDGRTGPNGPK